MVVSSDLLPSLLARAQAEGKGDDDDDSDDDSDDDMSGSEDDEDEEGGGRNGELPPQMHIRSVAHMGGINRLRSMGGQRPGIVAVWGDSGQVKVRSEESRREAKIGEDGRGQEQKVIIGSS